MENPIEKGEKVIEKRKEKIKNWFKNPYNFGFFLVIVLAIAIRIYYFILTQNQPLWWDEAEYALRAKAFAFGTPLSGWASEREIFVPLIFALILKIGLGEIGLRFLQFLVSVSTVAMTYVVFSKIISKRVGLFASFGMTFFWLHMFFSERILLYLWAPLLYLIIIYFFYTGYIKNNKRDLILFAVFSSIGLQIYFSIGFLLFGIAIFIFLSEGLSVIKNKKVWLVLGIFIAVLIPYMIYSQITYGFPIARLARGYGAVVNEQGAGFSGLFEYIKMFPSRIGWTFTALFYVGILYFIAKLVLEFGVKGSFERNKDWLIVFTGFFAPFICYTLYGTIGGSGTFYDAFILPLFPFAFAFAGLALEKIYSFASKYNNYLAIIIVVALLLMHAYSGTVSSDSYIKAKLTSYDSVRDGGLWIKAHSNPQDIVVSRSVPQNTYYSERETYPYNNTEEDFDKFIQEKKPKFMVDSIWENTEQWIHDYPSKHNNTVIPVQAYFLDKQKTQASLIVYEIKY